MLFTTSFVSFVSFENDFRRGIFVRTTALKTKVDGVERGPWSGGSKRVCPNPTQDASLLLIVGAPLEREIIIPSTNEGAEVRHVRSPEIHQLTVRYPGLSGNGGGGQHLADDWEQKQHAAKKKESETIFFHLPAAKQYLR
ncbi:hypothetical protein CEXT_405091 [Caerostris extrusa]|uniref:Uncharacterized protein n=1 Tax=Caerostris extrusa TaxID=172846 RepID=A0AAV4V822_CAEEX|nr:hypothetical protein CEXT_405091 [Caerostris extrusa]